MNRGARLTGAVSRSNMTAVQSLLDQGYDPNTEGYKGDKPIYFASSRGDSEMLTLLLRHGASVSSPWGEIALDAAVGSGDVDTVKILLQNGVDPDKPGRSRRTARERAKEDNQAEILALINRHTKE